MIIPLQTLQFHYPNSAWSVWSPKSSLHISHWFKCYEVCPVLCYSLSLRAKYYPEHFTYPFSVMHINNNKNYGFMLKQENR
jgi:hypothetical protein